MVPARREHMRNDELERMWDINARIAKFRNDICDNCGGLGDCSCNQTGIGSGVPDYLTDMNVAIWLLAERHMALSHEKSKSVWHACSPDGTLESSESPARAIALLYLKLVERDRDAKAPG